MKNFKIAQLFMLMLAMSNTYEIVAQISLFPAESRRTQYLNQYTSVFICSPNNGTVIQNIHDDSQQTAVSNSDSFYKYENGGYVWIPQDPPAETIMEPGRGYILSLGGNGTIGETIVAERSFDFSGGAANNGTVPTTIYSGFNILGNPYIDFLDLDLFLLNSNNRTKVKGPIMLWTHNTILSDSNTNPNDSNVYVNSANDFALYNVLGGVASGRQISTSPESGTNTGIQTPNGKICFGTGFGIYSIGSGSVIYDNTMRTNDNGGQTQSFRLSTDNNEEEEKTESNKLAALVPSSRSRIWLNLERGVPPTSGTNYNPLKQILVGYSPCYGQDCATTSDSDRVFDAETVTADSSPSIDFYSFAVGSTKHLAIQGRGDFQKTDSFKLGYYTTGGTFTITSSHDGLFLTNQYYILDADDTGANVGVYHSLPYTFTTGAGTFDNRFKVVFENLVSITTPTCGIRLGDIDNSVFSTIIPGATAYKFQVRTVSDTGPILGEYNAPSPAYPHVFKLNFLGIEFDKSYWVSVATYKINGVWQYGPTCMFTTPEKPKTRQLNPNQCGIILPNVPNNTWTTLFVTNVPIVGIPVERYRFHAKIGNTTFGSPFENTNNSCTLRSFGAALSTNTTYSIAVQIKWNNTWQDIGNYCDVTTSSTIPRFSQNDFSIFEVSAFPNPFANNFKLEINTSNEEQIQLSVFDMIGRQIESRSINISDLDTQEFGEAYNSGVYNVIVRQGENIKTLRMIKR